MKVFLAWVGKVLGRLRPKRRIKYQRGRSDNIYPLY